MSLEGKVLVTGESVAASFLAQLEDAGLTVSNPRDSFPPAILSDDQLVAELEGCRGYLLGGDEVASRQVLDQVSGLEIISFLGVGYQSFVDAEAAASVGVPVTNTPGVLANSVAEFTIGLLLEARRNIITYATDSTAEHRKESDIAGHSVGIVGLGAIGTRIAEILTQGFRAEVSYYSRTRKPSEESRLGLRYSSLGDLVSDVEVLILMVPETPETTNLLNAEILAQRSADEPLLIINTARAEVVDPAALADAMERGSVGRATFDGYYREESNDSRRLRDMPGFRLTPHIASLTHDARDAMAQLAVDSILQVLGGQVPASIVNPTYAEHQSDQ
jgi:lactate dehydrogenase-like 2-hydroxyacid dehydrogenase